MSATVSAARSSAIPTVLIEPTRGWTSLRLRDAWEYRELLFFLTWRDVKVRYKQTALGAAWAILQPLLTMVVFTIFFGRLANVGSEGVPYPIFSYAGLLPWIFFAQGLSQSAESLVGSSNLIRKVFFPRLVIPLAALLSAAVDFAVAFIVLLAMMAYYGIWPSAAILALPLPLALAFATALGTGLWLSALNVRFRDVRYVVPFFIQLWLFVTPVIYPTSRVTEMLAGWGCRRGYTGSIRWRAWWLGSVGPAGAGARPGGLIVPAPRLACSFSSPGRSTSAGLRRPSRTWSDGAAIAAWGG